MLAIGIHGLLFGMEFDCLKKKHVYRPETRAITMTLAYLQTQVIQPKSVVKKSLAKSVLNSKAQKKPLISKKISKKMVRAPVEAYINVAVAVDIKKKMPVVREAMPLYKVNPIPEYPRLARKRGYQGTVVLDVLVNQNGRVGDLRLFTSSGYSILDRKAMESVKVWLFEPGMKWNRKVDMWVRVPVSFKIKSSQALSSGP